MGTNNARKICHLTTVHVRYDTRIFVKECCGLAKNGYDVTLIVADGQGDEEKNGVNILDIGKPSGRLQRILTYYKKILKKALELEAEIYHFHDPELLRISSKLKKRNKKVIYDSHEDVPRQVLDKAYIPSFLRKTLSGTIERYENRVVSKLDGIVTVTPKLENRFLKYNNKVVQVRNYPELREFENVETTARSKKNTVCYIGSISKVRGVLNMIQAMHNQDKATLLLGGNFESEELRNKAISLPGWKNVKELGFLNRSEVKDTLINSLAGLVVLEPTRSYVDSIPVKMFEYMMAGIAVIASDFQYWRELIESENCAIFVDPLKPEAIRAAISQLIDNPDLAKKMGQNGKKAVLERFNWAIEEKKLLDFYAQL